MAIGETQLSDPNFTSQLNIESLIAAPLIAASKANVVMITGQTRALLENCFYKKNNSDDHYHPVMINMVLMRGVAPKVGEPKAGAGQEDEGDIKTARLAFSIPLICLIPINNLVVDKVNVDFDLEITSVYHEENTKGLADGKPINDRKAALHGKIANRNNSGTTDEKGTARLKVNINAAPLPLPLGLLTVLDLYTKSIQPTSPPKPEPGNVDF